MADGQHVFFMVLAASLFKSLFLKAYTSTDFEVHRNWLAITHSLPVRSWYFEDTSIWTLDYPPLFAWFEFAWSLVARAVDKEMVQVDNLEYHSATTVVFQRASVIVSDLVLAYAVCSYCKHREELHSKGVPRGCMTSSLLTSVLVFVNYGLIVVDHIHFQYNGFLFGLLLLSITNIVHGKHLIAAFWFAILLNFKHIFLYVAPAFGIFLLRSYCFPKRVHFSDSKLAWILGVEWKSFRPLRFIFLAWIVSAVFAISFGPFMYLGQLSQVLSRLFPVKRGLCHAYWAANFWAVYNLADKVLSIAGTRLNLLDNVAPASLTGGLVAEQQYGVLPNVSPYVTAVVTLATLLPALAKVWYRPDTKDAFLRLLVLCAFSSFLFGYHVHEKAILLIVIPLSLLAVTSPSDARVFMILSSCGHFALLPLLYQSQETPIKVALFLAFTIFSSVALYSISRIKTSQLGICCVRLHEAVYIWGLVPLFVYTNAIHPYVDSSNRLPFLPLMMTSLYCAAGVVWSWGVFYADMLWSTEKESNAMS